MNNTNEAKAFRACGEYKNLITGEVKYMHSRIYRAKGPATAAKNNLKEDYHSHWDGEHMYGADQDFKLMDSWVEVATDWTRL